MRQHKITAAKADAIYQILVDECGAQDDKFAAYSFVHHVAKGTDEYRFIGSLGFGGKFRNNQMPCPYVDCYREDETPARLKAIERANARLKVLFGG